MALEFRWLLNAALQALRAAPENKLCDSPRYSADSRYIQDITARPGLLSVTESVALPPQPKGRLHAEIPRIQSSRLAGTSGIDADLSCAAGRRCDGNSMVIERSAASLQDGLSPIKQSQSSLALELEARAVIALDEAREMPPGDERTEATHKAVVLRNAAELHGLLCGKRGAPAA
jgi:hypothetical protein